MVSDDCSDTNMDHSEEFLQAVIPPDLVTIQHEEKDLVVTPSPSLSPSVQHQPQQQQQKLLLVSHDEQQQQQQQLNANQNYNNILSLGIKRLLHHQYHLLVKHPKFLIQVTMMVSC